VRIARLGLFACSALLLGCQSYEPRPLDSDAHRAAVLARTPSDEGVAAFARRLADEGQPSEYNLADGLSLREAEAVALFFNSELRLARLRAGVAQAGAKYAGLWEDPELGVDAERIIESVDHPWIIGASVGFTLPISGRLAVEEARANAEHRAELRRVAAEEWSVRNSLRAAWLEWSANQERSAAVADLLLRIESILSIVSQLEAAGELSRTEGRLFRIELASRRNALLGIDAAARELELGVHHLMGLAPSAPLSLTPTLAAAAVADPADESWLTRNPGLAALRADYDVAEEALRLEIRKQYPDIVIAPGLKSEDGDTRVLLGVSLPIPLWNRNQRDIAEADARRELARAAFETTLEGLESDLALAHARYDAARAQRSALETEIVPLVEQQDAETRRVAGLGEVDTFILLESLTRLHDIKVALIDARLAESLAALRLHELLGPPASARSPAEAPAPAKEVHP
jgi:outer membrane protein, heavy metal efflux system